MPKYQSITTPNVQHDPTNFLTEIFFLNKYGALPQYPWRKGNFIAKEWGSIVSIFRKLIKVHHVDPEQIGWYLHEYLPKKIDSRSFGLMVWQIKKLFHRIDLDYLQRLYDEKFKKINKNYMNIKDDFASIPIKEDSGKKDLLSILKDLEKSYGKKEDRERGNT